MSGNATTTAPTPGAARRPAHDRLLRACRGETVDTTPVWFMRQAGRYLPEYRALREQHELLEMIKEPELAAEVTLQPMRRFDLDAAIIFADILTLLEGMGLELSFVAGEGPVIHNPVRAAADVDSLVLRPAAEALPFTLEALKLVRPELGGRPLIGFSGAPFTLAAYAIEGGSSRDFLATKRFLFGQPDAWRRLLDKLARAVGEYLAAQIAAGAQMVQIFDSWAGCLSPADYRAHVLPHVQRAIQLSHAAEHDVPLVYFATGATGLLPHFTDLGADVIGVDWRIDLSAARAVLGPDLVLQGNLDPGALFAPPRELCRRAQQVLDEARGQPHIFNLGHGLHKETPPEQVARLIDFVHGYGRP